MFDSGVHGFSLRRAGHEFQEELKHTAAPDAPAPGLTRCPKIEGSCAPRTRGADARRARGYLPAMRLPARCRPRWNRAKFDMVPLSWFTLTRLSNRTGRCGGMSGFKLLTGLTPRIARQHDVDGLHVLRGSDKRRNLAGAQPVARRPEPAYVWDHRRRSATLSPRAL
jgi:hypothetical protein